MFRTGVLWLLIPLILTGCLDRMVQERVSALETQIARNPTDAAAHRELGRVWFDAGYDRKAVEHLDLAVKLDPSDGPSYTLLGIAYTRLNDYERAIRVLQAGQAFGTAENSFALGVALLGAGRPEEAVAGFREAFRKNPALARVFRVAVGEAETGPAPETQAAEAGPEPVLQEVLHGTFEDQKEQIRQEVREQLAEDLVLGR